MLERGDQISARARQVKFGRVMLLLFTGVFYLIGWCAAKVFGVVWFAVVWVAIAVADGWQQGRPARSP